MPGLFDHCMFRDDAEIPCAVIATGHTRFRETTDPQSPEYRPAMVQGLRRLSLEMVGRWVPGPRIPVETQDRAVIEARRSTKVRFRLGEKVPGRL